MTYGMKMILGQGTCEICFLESIRPSFAGHCGNLSFLIFDFVSSLVTLMNKLYGHSLMCKLVELMLVLR